MGLLRNSQKAFCNAKEFYGKIKQNGEIGVTFNIRVVRCSNSTSLQHTATAFMALYWMEFGGSLVTRSYPELRSSR
jgi:hypothetical protein